MSGRLLKWRQRLVPNPAATNVVLQDGLLEACARLSGVTLSGA